MVQIKKATDPITVQAVKILLYGQPGVRKTSYSFTAPAPLLIDCDNGIRRLEPQYRKDYVSVTSWEEVVDAATGKHLNENGYKSIIIDTVGRALDLLADYLMKKDHKLARKDGNLTLQGYGALKVAFQRFVINVLSHGRHLIFVAHDKETKNGDDTMIRPDITGASLGTVIRDMDLVGYMQSVNNQATVSFSPSDTFYGKNTCNFPDRIVLSELPLEKVFSEYEIRVNQLTDQLRKYQADLKHVEFVLSNVKDADGLNEAIADILKTEFVMDGKMQASQMFREKAKELGLTLNKQSKLYEVKPVPVKEEAAAVTANTPKDF